MILQGAVRCYFRWHCNDKLAMKLPKLSRQKIKSNRIRFAFVLVSAAAIVVALVADEAIATEGSFCVNAISVQTSPNLDTFVDIDASASVESVEIVETYLQGEPVNEVVKPVERPPLGPQNSGRC
jgi:hypothetical protein